MTKSPVISYINSIYDLYIFNTASFDTVSFQIFSDC